IGRDAAGVVRPAPPRPAVARAAWRNAGPVSRLAFRDHVAADHGRTVGPRFGAFLARWPNVRALAASPLDDVLHEWQGLGYYERARNLHACARQIVAAHGGEFPADEAMLRALPGIGAYTAAAVAALAFDIPATPLDGNIERVVARLFAVEEPLPGAKEQIRALAATLTPARRPGDYAQAAMDLGATICTPWRPACALCPWPEP